MLAARYRIAALILASPQNYSMTPPCTAYRVRALKLGDKHIIEDILAVGLTKPQS